MNPAKHVAAKGAVWRELNPAKCMVAQGAVCRELCQTKPEIPASSYEHFLQFIFVSPEVSSVIVSPELSSVRDYVITHSVRSM